MMLLALVTLALLTLSTQTIRSSSHESAQAQAKANARLALMLALGDLQKFAGNDTRVTAPANILDKDHPMVTGVWKSWQGTDHETQGRFKGRPIQPDYGAKRRTTEDGGRFLSWLASSAENKSGTDKISSIARNRASPGWIPILGAASLPTSDQRQVHLKPVSVEGKTQGSYAWWVSGENQKARLPAPYEPEQDNAARWSTLAKSHATADPEVFQLDSLLDDSTLVNRMISLSTTSFISDENAPVPANRYFHDLSTNSVGLLTNTATGGWRKDLSLVTENWKSLPRSGLPFFRYTPHSTSLSARPHSGDPQPQQSMLYPWTGYRDRPGRPPIYQHGGVSSWHNLMDYATAYKRISTGHGKHSIPFTATHIWHSHGAHNFLHKIRTIPVIARIHWVFSHQTSRISPHVSGEPTHRLHLLMTPVVTMWNPYNVSITSEPLRIVLVRPIPCAFRYGNNTSYYCLTRSGSYPSMGAHAHLYYDLNQTFTLGPGETRVFSPSNTSPSTANRLNMAPGYRSRSGHIFNVKDDTGQPVALEPSSRIETNVKFDTAYRDGAHGVGNYINMNSLQTRDLLLVYRMVIPVETARKYWKEIPAIDLTSPTAQEVENNPQPFLSTVFGSRVASDSHLPGKGLIQTSPLVNYTVMGKTKEYGNIRHEYAGAYHPINSPFDYSFIKHAPGDSRLPNADATNHRGYIISGFDKSNGLSRIVLSELPLRPLASLGELQNWDMRYENPVPPYQLNVIGNSDASALIPSHAVVNSSDDAVVANLQHDDSYCANHLLFDDWFFSSIAPDPTQFGPGGTNMRTRFVEFLTKKKPLPNRSYRPILEDHGLSSADAAAVFDKNFMSNDGWQRVASRLEVEGMFNVNSTSVTAWRALLGHARNHKIPYITESNTKWPIKLSQKTDHAFSRFTIAGDVEAGKRGTAGAFPDSSEFSGYRVFSKDTLDALAEEIVVQVRRRGPFLSLSEFINRQLGSGDLALAGAIQTALNNLSDSASSPYKVLQDLSDDAGVAPDQELADAGYQFPEAAQGKSSYGLPGWTRQADILRPLAPILTARDDTFTIRAYGETKDADGNVTARAWCEATVSRTRDFIDPRDAADRTDIPQQTVNRKFGRRFVITSFRWLSPNEV